MEVGCEGAGGQGDRSLGRGLRRDDDMRQETYLDKENVFSMSDERKDGYA